METRSLPCALTDIELAQRRDKMVELLSHVDELESEKKNNTAALKARIEGVNTDLREIAYEVRTRSELREVEVRREKSFELGQEDVIRCDTGEIVETRALSPSERQAELTLIRGDALEDARTQAAQ